MKAEETGKKVALHTLGCKVNAYETEAMREMLLQAGYEIVPFEEVADIYIVNTCTVTNIADRKSRQMLRRAKKMNPDGIVVAVGCYVQAQAAAGKAGAPYVDLMIGNDRKQALIPLLEAYARHGKGREIVDINQQKTYENLTLAGAGEHTRAFIKVQDGCNQFCSYCLIPYVRGRVRSRQVGDVVAEVKRLAQNGYREVVLTGIHVSSYGADINSHLLELLQAIHGISGICRIRLGSLEPRIMTEAFVQELSTLPKVCPHFHLSLQSGCDATLQRMNRQYTGEMYLEVCARLRKYFVNPALTTDIIVGFPGETEEEFQTSMELVDRVGFYEIHIFKYSKRAGTRAAEMAAQISEEVKTKRSQQMKRLQQRHKALYEKSFAGKEVEVLVEETIREQGKIWQVGHTREYIRVTLPGEKYSRNELVTVRL